MCAAANFDSFATDPINPAEVVVVVLTTPRGKTYLQDTIASLNAGGARDVGFGRDALRVLHDGLPAGHTLLPIPPDSEGWSHELLSEVPSGNLRAFMRVFELFLEHDEHASHLLFFEDDIVVCKNALATMLQIGVPADCAFTSFFDMKEAHPLLSAGLYRVSTMGQDGRGYWGSQALLWPRRSIEFLVSRKDKILASGNLHSSDCLFGAHLLYSPWIQYALCVPNLVEHVGDVSAIWSWVPKVNRKSTSFRGQTFDAQTLLQEDT